MLAFSNMVHFFADELARLRARRLPFASIFLSALQSFLLRHTALHAPSVQTSDAPLHRVLHVVLLACVTEFVERVARN